jgi:4-diphosphocytidyl-2-C-methyl-D-erythritol kinase
MPEVLTLKAPAKLNLTLEVLAKRPDGYHEIRSILQMISLCDSLIFEAADSLSFSCDDPDWIAEKSLVSRAARALKHRFGVELGASIQLNKCIPLSSGLGGDSSDAVATLKGLTRLWNLKIGKAEISELAISLGSDIAFFVEGPTALAQGRGEIITPLPAPAHSWVVLLIPDIPLIQPKTAHLYSLLRKEDHTDGAATDRFASRIKCEGALPKDLFNVFEEIAFGAYEGLERYFNDFQKASNESRVHLCGAGPALFSMFSREKDARCVFETLKMKGFVVHLAETLRANPLC